MKDYLENAGIKSEKGVSHAADDALRILFKERHCEPPEITDEIRLGYREALKMLPYSQKVIFRLRAEAGLTYEKIAAVCRSSNNIRKLYGETGALLPVTASGARQTYMKALKSIQDPDVWRYIGEGYTRSAQEDDLLMQTAHNITSDRIYELPKSIQDALMRNGIYSLNDKRLKDKNRKLSGIGPKKMSYIASFMKF